MNIHGYKNKLKKAREMLVKAKKRLEAESRKGKKKNSDNIEFEEKRLKQVKDGMKNLREKIKKLKLEKKRGKKLRIN